MPIPFITSPLVSTAICFAPYNDYQVTATNDPTSFAAENLPAGLSISGITGKISGTPTLPGVFRVQLSATNTSGTGTALLVFTIPSTEHSERMQLVAPIAILLNRLYQATKPDGLLAGLKLHGMEDTFPSGEADVPFIIPTELQFDDNIFAGGQVLFGTDALATEDKLARGVLNYLQEQKIDFVCALSRKNGLYDRRNTGLVKDRGALEWLTLIRKVMRTSAEDGLPDGDLSRTCDRPISIAMRKGGVGEISWVFVFTVSLWPRAFVGGTENDLIPYVETA